MSRSNVSIKTINARTFLGAAVGSFAKRMPNFSRYAPGVLHSFPDNAHGRGIGRLPTHKQLLAVSTYPSQLDANLGRVRLVACMKCNQHEIVPQHLRTAFFRPGEMDRPWPSRNKYRQTSFGGTRVDWMCVHKSLRAGLECIGVDPRLNQTNWQVRQRGEVRPKVSVPFKHPAAILASFPKKSNLNMGEIHSSPLQRQNGGECTQVFFSS